MGFDCSSASKKSSWATVKADSASRIGPYIIMTLSLNRREKISYDRSPRPVCSMTIGTRPEFDGEFQLEAKG